MKLIKKYQQGNTINIPQREGYEIKLAKDIKPGRHTMVYDPEYGEIPFETYQLLFPNDYFYVKAEENDPEQLIIEPTSSPHRMAWYRVPYYDQFKFAQGYNQFDAERRNNILSGSLYRQGNPDPTDNALNSAITGVAGLTRYGWKETGQQALKGLNLFGKALTPSTYTTALFGTGFGSTMAGLGLDAATFGSLAYGSVKDMINNGVNVENLLGATMSIPAVASAYNMYKTAKTGKNLYNLINAMNKALEDPEMRLYLYNRASNTDFLPTVYETGIKPTFNATTTVKTNQGLIAYDPAHLQKHFEQDITPEFVKDLVENSSSLSQKGKSRNLADLKGKNNIVLFYPNKDNINFMTASVEVPEQFSHINFSFSNSLEDNSFLGYPSGVQNYNWVKVGENSFKVPKPLLRVTHGADVDSRPYPLRVVFNGNPFEIEKELHNLRKYTYLNEDVNPDFVLRTAYPAAPTTTSTGVNNTSRVYSGIEVPSYLDFVKWYPKITWNPINGTPSNLPVKEQWYNTVDEILDDIMSPEYNQHISRELGYKVDPVDIRRTLIRRYTGTMPYERNLNYGDFPLSKVGSHTFQGVDAKQAKDEGLSFFDYLKKYNKINSKYSTEDEFLASLSENEKLAYRYAKDGERKVLGVELPGGEYGSLFNTPLEEAYHIQDIGNEYTPWMRAFDAHNDELLKYIQPIVPQLGGKEALPRLRAMQRMYRDHATQLKDYYVGLPEYKIPQQFYTDYLRGDKKLYDYLNLTDYIKENNLSRFDFEIKNGYKRNKALINAAEHIVYNEGSESQDSSMA